jgi:DNA-binding transcriptional LysR family regulator
MSQPAASQQLAGLERAIGTALFVRTSGGLQPTAEGRSLYAEVSSALDQLEDVLSGLDAGKVRDHRAALRFGSSAEFFNAELLPRLTSSSISVTATFDTDTAVIDALERGELDAVVTSSTPPRRSIVSTPIGEKRFALVASPTLAPATTIESTDQLGLWLRERPWVAYSSELPITRRFWQATLGQPFAAPLRIVAPDLRAVVSAVERGLGCSILPNFVCADALTTGRIVEIFNTENLIAPEPWFLCVRHGETTRAAVTDLVKLFQIRPL